MALVACALPGEASLSQYMLWWRPAEAAHKPLWMHLADAIFCGLGAVGGCYAAKMDPDGTTNWAMIVMCFAYASIGWLALGCVHFYIKRRKQGPQNQQQVAKGYGTSWQSNSQSNF